MNLKSTHQLVATLAIAFLASSSLLGKPVSVTPVVQDAEWARAWWMPRHEEKLAEAKERGKHAELLFIGDSITHHWNKGLWAENFEKYEAFNLGFSGDRTEHVLWRIENDALENLSPKVTVIMIGTNNTGHSNGQVSASDIVLGIETIIDEVQKRLPDTEIILHSIFPRGSSQNDPLRLVNEAVNESLPELAKQKNIRLLDINKAFLENNGTLPKNIMPDLLHPNQRGYQIWADKLTPVLREYFEEPKEAAENQVISLWPTSIPNPHDTTLKERTINKYGNLQYTDVDEPSITLFPVKSRRATGFVLVCPGGGYSILSWEKEGVEVARWLNSIGFSAAVLKYRTPKNRLGALQDTQRALGIIRSRSDEWNVDPSRIGILGFSAGGHLSATASNNWLSRAYPKIDQADNASCRPDFTALIYPAYMGDENLELKEEFTITDKTPPAFVVQTQDDIKYVMSAYAYSSALHKAGIGCEVHIYPTGGHGYGLRPSAYPVSEWKDLCRDWLLRQ